MPPIEDLKILVQIGDTNLHMLFSCLYERTLKPSVGTCSIMFMFRSKGFRSKGVKCACSYLQNTTSFYMSSIDFELVQIGFSSLKILKVDKLTTRSVDYSYIKYSLEVA